MTYDEYKNLKVGDELLFKGINEICEVLDTNWSDFNNDTFHLIGWRGLTIMFDEGNLDQFTLIRKRKYSVPIEVTSIVYYDVEAQDEDDAFRKAVEFARESKDDDILNMSSVTNWEVLENIEEE